MVDKMIVRLTGRLSFTKIKFTIEIDLSLNRRSSCFKFIPKLHSFYS